ncbi:MAG TPA: ATP-binding protein [Xanthobacteraceae bacterium]|nr:ATP-binding protein [Xanthobacteraceae bacterium]
MSSGDGQTRTFRVTPDGISAADAWIEEVGRHWGIAERTAFGARICVAEIAANVLEHGGIKPDGPAQLGVTLTRRDSGLDVEITDSGRPFDPTAAPELPVSDTIEAAHIGGLGLRLVRSYASEVTYRHDGVCNRLTLRLRTAPPRSAACPNPSEDPCPAKRA